MKRKKFSNGMKKLGNKMKMMMVRLKFEVLEEKLNGRASDVNSLLEKRTEKEEKMHS